MRILALEPYYGGSHRDFLDGWVNRSRHEWTLFTLPPTKWKWRMRHSAVTFGEEVNRRVESGERWDVLFCSDMLNLAEFLGLAPGPVRSLPSLVYFHENQITYPVEHESEFDYHFAYSNMTSALASRRVWFNSAYHRESFLRGLGDFLKRMPDHQTLGSLDAIRAKSRVRPPGIDGFPQRGERRPGPLRILWAARWEYDKAPEKFFAALEPLASRSIRFELSVIGGGGARRVPPAFDEAKLRFQENIVHWGFLESREKYRSVLAEADVVVSTALHEFFGMGLVEAVAAGAFPLVPNRLAYPEVLAGGEVEGEDSFFYEDDGEDLARRLVELAERLDNGDLWQGEGERGVRAVAKFSWSRLQPEWDLELERLAGLEKGPPPAESKVSIRAIEEKDREACVAVAQTLPEWFNDHARNVAIPTDLEHQQGFLAEWKGRIIGFITLFVSDGRLNINWIAVHKEHRRRGVGGKLIAWAERAAADMDITELATWTLGDGVEYEPYERTRAFYRKCGFTVYQRSRTDNPDCPEEIRIKKRIDLA